MAMMTTREAHQRLQQSNMTMSRRGASIEYRVTFAELTGKAAEDQAYYTDDLEDAVFSGQSMRRRGYKKIAA